MKMSVFNRPPARRGFTIVELVVVIAIVAILATISIVASVNIAKANRDAARESDVLAMQQAIEKYYRDHGEYPATNDSAFFSQFKNSDPFDDTAQNSNRVADTGFCTRPYAGTGNPRARASCKNYGYVSFTNNSTNQTILNEVGTTSTGCRLRLQTAYQTAQNPPVWSWYVLSRYDERTQTIKYYSDSAKVRIETNVASSAFPGQVCQLEN